MPIRRADFSDLTILVGLDREIFTANAWPETEWRSELQIPHALVWLFIEDIPCGFVSAGYAGDDLEIRKIGILPQHRRRGFAAQLLNCVLEAKLPSVRRCLIEASENNAPALCLYRSLGFRELARRIRYYPDGSTAIVMEKIVSTA